MSSPATSSRTPSPFSSPAASPRATKSSSPSTSPRRYASTHHASADARDAVTQALANRRSRRERGPQPYVKPRPPTSERWQVSTAGLLSPLKPEGRTIYGFGLRLEDTPEERPAHLWMEEIAAHEHKTRAESGDPVLEAVAGVAARRALIQSSKPINLLPLVFSNPEIPSCITTAIDGLTKEEEELWDQFINPDAFI